MFKAPRRTAEIVLTTGRVLPGSEDIEAFLNNPQLAKADQIFLKMADDQLRANWMIATNQTHYAPWADLYFEARVYLGVM